MLSKNIALELVDWGEIRRGFDTQRIVFLLRSLRFFIFGWYLKGGGGEQSEPE